jgi:Leucine-rich repeat (LRR) protein
MDDVIQYIFTFLKVENILLCTQVDKNFNKISKNESLWKNLIPYYFKTRIFRNNYYETFKICHELKTKTKGHPNKDHTYIRRQIILIEEKLTKIPVVLKYLDNMRSLLIINNKNIKNFEVIGQLQNLEMLTINYCMLSSIPTEWCNLDKLERLGLSHNNLVSIPTEIGKLQKLTNIYFDYNNLVTIPTEFGKLQQLKAICANNNKLVMIPTEIGNLNNLIALEIYQGTNRNKKT